MVKGDNNETERKKLHGAVFREYEALKQAHAFKMASQTAETQKKQLELQQQLAADMRLLVEKASTGSEANSARQIPVEAETSARHD